MDDLKTILKEMRAYNPKADEHGGKFIIPGWADRIEKALGDPLDKTDRWDGKDLPPVGCECEWFESQCGWTPVKIVYKSKWVIVMRSIKEGLGKDVDISRDLVLDKLQEFRPL